VSSFLKARMRCINYIPVNFFGCATAFAVWQKAKRIWVFLRVGRLTATFHAAVWAFVNQVGAIKHGG